LNRSFLYFLSEESRKIAKKYSRHYDLKSRKGIVLMQLEKLSKQYYIIVIQIILNTINFFHIQNNTIAACLD
jgi:hypothetical protein